MLSPATEDKYRDDGESENGMEGQKENEKQEGKISLTTSQEDNFNLQLLFVSFKLW